MKFAFTLLLFFSLHLTQSFGQAPDKRNNMWAFGVKSGFDFNTGSPTSFVSAMSAVFSCASVCDTAGNLLFYADHSKVYTRGHGVMPNGTGMAGISNRQQTIIIAPRHGDDSKYYIFMINAANRLVYSIVDMRLNSGLGDVMPGFKNISMDSNQVEKLMVMEMCGDMWLIAHHENNPIFYAYDLKNPSRFSLPVVSIIGGPNHYGCHTRMTSCNRLSKINLLSHGLTGGSYHSVEDFDFDYATGVISNRRLIDSIHLVSVQIDGGIYSPDFTKLYVLIPGSVLQYDMTLPTVSDIRASKVVVGTTPAPGQFRLASNGKIYLYGTGIGPACIENPNLKGLLCNLRTSVPIPWSYRGEFGNDFVSYTVKEVETRFYSTTVHLCIDSAKTLGEIGFKSYIWYDGDAAATKTFTKGGKYWRRAFGSCYNQTDTFIIVEDTPTHIMLSVDTIVCFDSTALLSAPNGYERFVWESGHTTKDKLINKNGYYVIEAFKNSSCPSTYRKQYKVEFVNEKTGFNFQDIQDTSACPTEVLNFEVKTTMSNAGFLWKNGDTTQSSTSYGPGLNWVKVKYKSCVALDSINIAAILPPIVLFDTIACQGEAITLSVAPSPGATYMWSTGDRGISTQVRENGSYEVVVSKEKCVERAKAIAKFDKCSKCINVPNAFTPNNDGINDRFKPLLVCHLKEFEIKIFDRWGKQIYFSNNFNDNWDGTYNGQLQPPNVYFYLIAYSFNDSEGQATKEIVKGDLTLLR